MKRSLILMAALGTTLFGAMDLRKAIESPDASRIIKKDLLGPAKKFTMPKGCITNDPKAIARGEYIFHNLNGGKAKKMPPEGLSKKQMVRGKVYKMGDKIPNKQYGNCVACHNIEGAKGAGNIGPDLTKYHEYFIQSGVRDIEFVYQKIADARIDNPDTHMTINLTTKLFEPFEICEIASYIVSIKK